eukprot:CAMPEP_0176069014 /NCGR_PEP_ID=MMETSP0120_2-20121206/34453_1 /TAXON_ID=160619 /ORGANISM="Kryptoperidinium foliaceum, Strain CCMP 1326" /LENGTH=245 /DNA_ID=CAMNT_0017402639 /DNA_START=82 /DNA_END=819 /DNA_ORIENTATION=-
MSHLLLRAVPVQANSPAAACRRPPTYRAGLPDTSPPIHPPPWRTRAPPTSLRPHAPPSELPPATYGRFSSSVMAFHASPAKLPASIAVMFWKDGARRNSAASNRIDNGGKSRRCWRPLIAAERSPRRILLSFVSHAASFPEARYSDNSCSYIRLKRRDSSMYGSFSSSLIARHCSPAARNALAQHTVPFEAAICFANNAKAGALRFGLSGSGCPSFARHTSSLPEALYFANCSSYRPFAPWARRK